MTKLTGENVKCQYCGKQFYVTQTRLKRSKTLTCSVECASELKKELYNEIRICEWCNKEYVAKKGSPKRFCCVKCQNEWQKTNVGYKNPKFQGMVLSCDYCGNDITVRKYNLDKYNHHFCDTECSKKWFKECYVQTEEQKERSRIIGANSTKHMSLNTRPQIIINELLRELNITYCNEYNVKYYSIDNYLSDYNLMVEVMGDYWHRNPLFYDYEINDMQKRSLRKDKAKHTYIKKYYGIEILYLWENDIYRNLDVCKKLIQLYIKQKGMINNYHSFNYYIEDNQLLLSNNIINTAY